MKAFRRRFRNRFRKPTVTVLISADISGYIEQMKKAERALSDLYESARKRVDLNKCLNEMRLIGEFHMERALIDLNVHVDGIYTDLGLVRDPHIERGES